MCVYVCIGGGSGIGMAISAAFLRHGATVVIASRSMDKLTKAAAELERDNGGKVCSDICTPVSWECQLCSNHLCVVLIASLFINL
jgi:NADP-dependent 3-hydroxy acid dehydrogenase YdfG